MNGLGYSNYTDSHAQCITKCVPAHPVSSGPVLSFKDCRGAIMVLGSGQIQDQVKNRLNVEIRMDQDPQKYVWVCVCGPPEITQ